MEAKFKRFEQAYHRRMWHEVFGETLQTCRQLAGLARPIFLAVAERVVRLTIEEDLSPEELQEMLAREPALKLLQKSDLNQL